MVIAVHEKTEAGKTTRHYECREYAAVHDAERVTFTLVGREEPVTVKKCRTTEVYVTNETGKTVEVYRWA